MAPPTTSSWIPAVLFLLLSCAEARSYGTFEQAVSGKPVKQRQGETDTIVAWEQKKLQERKIFLAPQLSASMPSSTGAEDPDISHYAGYFKLNRTHDARLFYWFFESRGDKAMDPLVLWMTGGPGCASELALFYENGPWTINADDLSLSWNPYGWDKVSNIIFIDQPVNTGFSYSNDSRDTVHDEKGVSEDMYEFLLEFLEVHPTYADRALYLTGESYAGHYLPAVASRVHTGNIRHEGARINLQGFAIGNGLTQPAIQMASHPEFCSREGLISRRVHDVFTALHPLCGFPAKLCGTKGKLTCTVADVVCLRLLDELLRRAGSGNLNIYDVRKNCTFPPLCYDFAPLTAYLNQAAVREALGVGDRRFQTCSDSVGAAMEKDLMRNLEPLVPPLLEDGLRLLVYVGEKDFGCNWLGQTWWLAAMEWSGKGEYNADPYKPFMVGGREAGIWKSAGPLTFLRVHDAGHMVPMDQPAASLEMLRLFLSDKPFAQGDEADPMLLAAVH